MPFVRLPHPVPPLVGQLEAEAKHVVEGGIVVPVGLCAGFVDEQASSAYRVGASRRRTLDRSALAIHGPGTHELHVQPHGVRISSKEARRAHSTLDAWVLILRPSPAGLGWRHRTGNLSGPPAKKALARQLKPGKAEQPSLIFVRLVVQVYGPLAP